jgi:hypothetical protein
VVKSKQRSGDGSCEDGEDRELDAEKRSDHGHQLDVAEAHAFRAAPAQVNRSRAVNERRAQSRAQQGIEQREQASGKVGAKG